MIMTYIINSCTKKQLDFLNNLSAETGIECANSPPKTGNYLIFSEDKLTLTENSIDNITTLNFDFVKMWKYHASQKYKLKNELFAKALGIKQKTSNRLIVYDATCGSGKDSVLMLFFGCRVVANERNNVIYSLLLDAHRRLFEYLEEINETKPDFEIKYVDAKFGLQQVEEKIDIIYCDPMYPNRNTKALPRKEIQIFKNNIGLDLDRHHLFEWALKQNVKKVIIKRPRKGVDHYGIPTATYTGKTTCYDMYFLGR